MLHPPALPALRPSTGPHTWTPDATPLAPDWAAVAALAAHLGGTPAALLLQAPAQGAPRLLGAHGLSRSEQLAALVACQRQLAIDRAEPPDTAPAWRLQPVPTNDAATRAWLAWPDTQPPPETSGPALQALLAHTASLLGLAQWQDGLLQQNQDRERRLGSALSDSQERLNLTEHTVGVGSWSIELDSGRMQHSAGYASIMGLPGEGVCVDREALLRCYVSEARAGMRQRLLACARSGLAFDEEIQVLVPGGPPKWVRTVGTAVRDASGRIERIQGAVQDISAQKQAREETLQLALRLSTTLASITEAFVTLDRDCRFTYLNPESERLLQQSAAALLGQPVWQPFGEAMAQRLRAALGGALHSRQCVELEDRVPALGKWLEVRAYPLDEGLAVYFRDVTERRRSQEHLMLLETSVSRLNDIVVIAETGKAGDGEPRIVFVNDAFELHTGYSRAEVMHQSPRMLFQLDPVLAKRHSLAHRLQQTRRARTELMVHSKSGNTFWVELEVVSVQATAEALTHWVAVGRDITQRKRAEDTIRHLAFYDPLTELPNRQLLLDRLKMALAQSARTGQHGALMFIDLDNFKILNDTLGHHMGDQLLQQVAQRLTQSVRKTDTVARLGGDEFVVMVDDLSTDPQAAAFKSRALAEKVLHTLREPFQIAGHQHFATPSIGVTAFDGQQSDVGELLKQADLAMYQAKTLGRNTLCFFDPALQAAMSANAALSAALRVGLHEQQFVVHYQPQVDRQGVITGVEALVRWRHPHRGLVLPADFIPVAEDTGLILPLGMWVLETACEQLAAWAQWPQTAGLSIAVNVSVHQFRHPNFVDRVMAAIGRTGIRPDKLKLELTESLLADRMAITIAKMGMLKALGVTLSLDDFGMGYSSLSVLKRLPLDQLKIDKAFVADVLTDPNDAAISRAIIALAQSLGLQVVAEGVETHEQRDFLAYQGCDQFQGHLFAPALPVQALEAFLGKPWTDRIGD